MSGSGIINASPASSDPPPTGDQTSSGLTNPLLRQAEQQLEANIVDPATKANYEKIVVAGLHIALAKGPDGGMASLIHSKTPVIAAAQGAVALVLFMRSGAKGVMPLKAMIPAGMTLMLHALDFLDRAKIAKIAEPELDQAATTFTNFLFHKLKITTAMIQQMSGRVHGLMQDPQAMSAINLKAGITRHPMAATQTPLPPGPTSGLMNGGTPR